MEYEEEKLTEALVLARTRAQDLESVKKLNFWGSDIENVRVVRKMPSLEVCSLSVNSITTLEDFSYCPNLQELYIRKNKIEDLSEINHLATLPRLRNLWLADNPCAETENYRPTVLRTLPNLQKLDNIVVSEDERPQADDTELLTTDTHDPEVTGAEVPGAEVTGADLEVTGAEVPGTEVTGAEVPGTEVTGAEVTGAEVTGVTNDRGQGACAADPEMVGISNHLSLNGSEDADNVISEPEREVKDSQKSKVKDRKTNPHRSTSLDPVTLTWEETNKIRQEVGLKPLPFEKITSPKPVPASAMASRNAHVLQAVLILIRELDDDSLETVQGTIRRKLHPIS